MCCLCVVLYSYTKVFQDETRHRQEYRNEAKAR